MSIAHPQTQVRSQTGFWDGQLGYAHAFVTVATSLALSLVLHAQVGYRAAWSPLALALFGGVPMIVVLVLGRVARQNRVVHWLTGIPFAVVTTVAVGVLALAGGIVPSSVLQQRFGMPSLWASWPFLIAVFLLMLNLVGAVGKRCWPLTYTNVVFLLSHAGLVVAIGGGAVSAMMLERHMVVLHEGVPTSAATDEHGHQTPMPFTVTLREFKMESFPPTAALATLDPTATDGVRALPGSVFLKAGASEKIGDAKLRVKEFLPNAVHTGARWQAVPWKSGAPAALVEVEWKGKKHEGWICSGSVEADSAVLRLDDGNAIVMPTPQPKKFLSVVDVESGSGKAQRRDVEVNRPITVNGYTLYQLSYDKKMGAASQVSVLEAVHDRGIGVVYLGLFMVLGACLLHMWNGVGGSK